MLIRDSRIIRHVAPRVRRALDRTRVTVTSRAYRHLVGVVCLPVRDAWFREHGVLEPLSHWFHRGLTLPQKSCERAYILGYVGDAALLVSGFWWESRTGKNVTLSVGELVEIGRKAYRNIGDAPYDELADKYPRLSETMAVLAANYTSDRDTRVVALCEAWRKLRDRRAVRILRHLGFPPGFENPSKPC